MTRDRARRRATGSTRFEGAGLDGVIAKPADGAYQPGKRAMIKIKHARTADCVVAGFRWHKSGKDAVGSLLLGLYDDDGRAAARRRHVVVHDGDAQGSSSRELAPLRERRARRIIRGASGPRPRRSEHDAHARRAEPLERRQGSVVGAAAHRARVRGEVRPPAGRSLPPRGDVPALAARQAAARLPLRSARGHDALRAREGLRRGPSVR